MIDLGLRRALSLRLKEIPSKDWVDVKISGRFRYMQLRELTIVAFQWSKGTGKDYSNLE